MRVNRKLAAWELAKKAKADNTKYLAREVGEAICHDIDFQLRECIEKHRDIIDEEEFCIVRLIATDCLIKPLKRIKYYAWPYLPSPRPNQAVFLYNKPLDRITKRLWVLPNPILMAKLASELVCPKEYETMKAWSVAFYMSDFWEYIRHEHDIDMLSEHEYLLQNRDKLIKAGCKLPEPSIADSLKGGQIPVEQIIDAVDAVSLENSASGFIQTENV